MESSQNRETDMKGRGETSQTKSLIVKHLALLALVSGFLPLMYNRLGAQNINGMMYALRRDVVDTGSLNPIAPLPTDAYGDLITDENGNAVDPQMPGSVTLRPDKRPRPLVLRMGAGDCMTITLSNLLAPVANPFQVAGPADCDVNNPGEVRSGIPFTCEIDDQVAARNVSLRFQGTELVSSIDDDGSFVGVNDSSLIAPGMARTFTIRAPKDGAFLGVSYGSVIGGQGLGGQTANGLWAVLNVNTEDAAFYRSQLTNEELVLSLDTSNDSGQDTNLDGYADSTGHPIINYEATYPSGEPWASEGKAGLPIINMFQNDEIVHNAIDA
jgi:hypothetical protein